MFVTQKGITIIRSIIIIINCVERQILQSLCSVDFHTFTLQLPIQTSLSVVSFCEFT